MIILSENGKVLVDAGSIFVSTVKNKEDKNKIDGYRVMGKGITSPKPITVKTFDGEDSIGDAIDFLKDLGESYGAQL